MIAALVALQLGAQNYALPPEYLRYCTTTPAAHCEPQNITLIDIARVHAVVNAAIRPIPDMVDRWTVWPNSGGDCDDVAVTLRQTLIALGVSPSTLRLSLGEVQQRGKWQMHLVLEIDFNGDTWIADSLSPNELYKSTNRPRPWRELATQSNSTVSWTIGKN